MTQQEYYIEIFTGKAEPCEWGSWNQYLIFKLVNEGPLDLVRVIGPVKTLAKFLRSEGYPMRVADIRPMPHE